MERSKFDTNITNRRFVEPGYILVYDGLTRGGVPAIVLLMELSTASGSSEAVHRLGRAGALLRDIRSESSKTLRGLAREINVDPSYISKVESGILPPSTTVIDGYVNALAIDAERGEALKDELRLLLGRAPADLDDNDARTLAAIACALKKHRRDSDLRT